MGSQGIKNINPQGPTVIRSKLLFTYMYRTMNKIINTPWNFEIFKTPTEV